MANYKTHSLFNVFLALPLLVLGIYFYLHPTRLELLTFVITFIYTTLFMSPDMDLAYKIKWYSIRGLLSIPFRTYARVFKHRGLSHGFIIGSITRILWLSLFIFLILYFSEWIFFSKKDLFSIYSYYKKELLYGFCGICLADGAHILLDKIKSKSF
jgi:uncharacterized metal-binding protein